MGVHRRHCLADRPRRQPLWLYPNRQDSERAAEDVPGASAGPVKTWRTCRRGADLWRADAVRTARRRRRGCTASGDFTQRSASPGASPGPEHRSCTAIALAVTAGAATCFAVSARGAWGKRAFRDGAPRPGCRRVERNSWRGHSDQYQRALLAWKMYGGGGGGQETLDLIDASMQLTWPTETDFTTP